MDSSDPAHKETSMSDEIEVNAGPDKADLLRAVTNADEDLHVIFQTAAGPLEACVDAIEESSTDGLTFGVRGRLMSGNLRGALFAGVYDSSSRTGRLLLRRT
jgi:DNA-binding NtrC family response regulator